MKRIVMIGLLILGGSQAFSADRNPCPFEQRAFANPAIVGEKQREDPMGDPADEI